VDCLTEALGQHHNPKYGVYLLIPQGWVWKLCCSITEINTLQFQQHRLFIWRNHITLCTFLWNMWWIFLSYLWRLEAITLLGLQLGEMKFCCIACELGRQAQERLWIKMAAGFSTWNRHFWWSARPKAKNRYWSVNQRNHERQCIWRNFKSWT
jgi:hypothetical protein